METADSINGHFAKPVEASVLAGNPPGKLNDDNGHVHSVQTGSNQNFGVPWPALD